MIVEATYRHARRMLAAGLRAADVQEIEAGSGMTPEQALFRSWAYSDKAWSYLVPHYGPIAMWGVAPTPCDPKVGIPWLLATEQIQHYRREFVRHTKHFVAEMSRGFRVLTNHVDVRHTESIRWLRWAGFTVIEPAVLIGPKHMPFYNFKLEL